MPRTTQSTNSFSKGKNVTSYIFPEKLHCSRCGNIYDFRELDVKDRHRCPQCKNNLNASRFIVVPSPIPSIVTDLAIVISSLNSNVPFK